LPERPFDGRVFGGVCLAVAHAWDLDVTLVRFAFFVLTLAWGFGIFLYVLAWLLMPTAGARSRDGPGATAAHNLSEIRGSINSSTRRISAAWRRVGSGRAWPPPMDRRWLGVTLMTTGALVVLASLGAFAWVTPTRAAGLGAIAIGISLMVRMSQYR
jgi:phage shock protein C